ncbi:MAG: valine--tRNA ligase [Gemmatimonadota bacterium]
MELGSRYDPSGIEDRLYAKWLDQGLFHPSAADAENPYVIVIPPPNVTAALHMGHALNNTIQDAVIRFERMRGRDALWVPGTDHAGIATQNVVERELAKQGQSRDDLGREAFVRRVWEWVDEYGTQIRKQLQKIGCSCDWERDRFTLDEGLSKAVREVFVALYENDLIYRGNYIINWCPRCQTALSNEEAEHEDLPGHLYHLKYPLADGSGRHVTVATTRPETMLGDTAVAIHPEDERHADLVGLNVELPLTGRTIPVIADEYVDPEFGSGVVKVTPAHDPNDFEIGRRHGLPEIDVMNEDATMSAAVPEAYRGLDRFEARKRVLADLESEGLLERTETHEHSVGHCYRCHTVVEPRLSLQWFVKMKPLAEPALEAYREGRLRFHPARFGNVYENWMVNVRDWCISRQLWWGHRIPVWYCQNPDCGQLVVSRQDPTECKACGGELRQDDDVLDTWFSSWLWPFSTLGWPEETDDLKAFYPTNTLVTAPEILFFWVARMVMAGIEFMGDIPFTDVLLNGTVRDSIGRRMSKSLGNGIDPLAVVDQFGADAMRYRLIASAGLGTDLQLDHADIENAFRVGRNFGNKIWNAVRFALPYLEGWDGAPPQTDEACLADRWILSRFNRAAADIADSFERFRLQDAADAVYHFIWDDFCDWYLELSKHRLRGDAGEEARATAAATLGTVLDGWLRLLHPIMPFITEELAGHLPQVVSGDTLVKGPWPVASGELADAEADQAFEELREFVSSVRNMRAEYKLDPGRGVPVLLIGVTAPLKAGLEHEGAGVRTLAKLTDIGFADSVPDEPGAQAVLRGGTQVFLALEGLLDLNKERERIEAEHERVKSFLSQTRAKLQNDKFTAGAPAEVVAREREKLQSLEEREALLLEKRGALSRSE